MGNSRQWPILGPTSLSAQRRVSVGLTLFNKESGTQALTTETGAGQRGSALAMACRFFDIDLEIYFKAI